MLQPFPYDQLYHYSEKFTRDPDLRQDLVLFAWKEDARLAERSDIRLLKNVMKYRAKEIKVRSPLGVDISGKSLKDVWSHERVSIFKLSSATTGNQFCLAETLTCVDRNPFSSTVVNQFDEALLPDEQAVCDGILGGYPIKDVKLQLKIDGVRYQELREAVREKALEYLA